MLSEHYCDCNFLMFIATSLHDVSVSQSGSRSTVQLAGVFLVILGVSPQLTQMLCSVPLAIHGDYHFLFKIIIFLFFYPISKIF